MKETEKMNMKVQTLAILLLATACGGAYATTGVTTSGTEITVCVEAGETLAMPPIGASITKVIKTGGGEAQFTPAGVTNLEVPQNLSRSPSVRA